MEIKYDSRLVENVVVEIIRRKEKEGDYELSEYYHRIADQIYDAPKKDREDEFKKLHLSIFMRLGLNEVINEVVGEFPQLSKIDEMVILEANTTEEADLLVSEKGQKRIVIKLPPEGFLSSHLLSRFMRHELMHISDILDEEFGYKKEKFSNSLANEIVIKEKYKLLWDIYVDSRLISCGKETIADKSLRYKEFNKIFQKIPEEYRERVFNSLWNSKKLTHNEILSLSKEPRKLLERSGISSKGILLRGTPCPLCGFPTYNWFENLSEFRDVIAAIKEDFPEWDQDDGACDRCVELYSLQVRGF
jgi:hypothetical protein